MNAEQQYGVIDQRFRNIEGQVMEMKSSLSGQIAAIASKMDERAKPQWQLMISSLGFMMTLLIALGSLAYMPIRGELAKSDNEIQRLREQIVPRSEHDSRNITNTAVTDKIITALQRIQENGVTKTEMELRLTAAAQRREDFQKATDTRLERIVGEMDDTRKGIVSRGEHEKIWRNLEQRDAELARMVEEIKASFGNTFSLRDAMQQMQKRIDEIETQRTAKEAAAIIQAESTRSGKK